MTRGIGSWDAISGRSLVIVNSPPEHGEAVAGVLRALQSRAADGLSIIAPRSWRPLLLDLGCDGDEVLYAVREDGQDYELNFFLEQLGTLHWILSRQFSCVIGTAPHSLYNEEVKDTLEQRVALFLGRGTFVAHAWPKPFLYFLELADLILRFDRSRVTREYGAVTRALIADLHRAWLDGGRPAQADGAIAAHDEVIAAHLGPLMARDERSGEPSDVVSLAAVAGFIDYAERVLHPAVALRDERLRELEETQRQQRQLIEHLSGEVTRRDAINAAITEERRQAVLERDAIIDRLRGELEHVTRGWRKLLAGRARI